MKKKKFSCGKLPWVLRALWNPIDACDLYDKDQQPDYEKIVPFLFLVFACVAHVVGKPLPWYALLALGSLSFGYGMWIRFLKEKNVTGTLSETIAATRTVTVNDATTTQNMNTTTTVRHERDAAEGVDPA